MLLFNKTNWRVFYAKSVSHLFIESLFVSQFSDSTLKQRCCYQTRNLLRTTDKALSLVETVRHAKHGYNQEACNTVMFQDKFPWHLYMFNLLLNRFKLFDVKLLFLVIGSSQGMLYCNALENFNSLVLKFLIL